MLHNEEVYSYKVGLWVMLKIIICRLFFLKCNVNGNTR